MKIHQDPSPNFGPRKDGKKAYILMLHYTDTLNTQQAVDILKNPERQVSAHYVVGDDGAVIQMVDEDMRAWHAGKSFWAGETDLNSVSIGIEIQNPGHTYGHKPFPMVQIETVRDLCRGIITRHNILPHHVLAHSDVAPGRKIDPGVLFPWGWLAGQGIGLMPAGKETGEADTNAIMNLLKDYGYDPNIDQKELITSFQMHFETDLFKTPEAVGRPSVRTLSILRDLNAEKSKQR